MSILSQILDSSIIFSFDRSGFLRHSKDFKDENWCGKGKVALITGANSGIGYVTAEILLKYNVNVHIFCRSEASGKEAVEKLKSSNSDGTITLHTLDISDKKAIDRWLKSEAPPHVDILVNNAGGMSSSLNFNTENIEITWATHLLGHYFLTSGLIEQRSLSKGSRVITVSSGGMYLQKLDLSDLLWKKQKYDKYRAYANAKRAQVILTQLWDEQLGPSIRFSTMHPGWVDTKGVKEAMPTFHRLLGPRLRSPKQGADTIIWLALTQEKYPGGKLWFDRKIVAEHKFNFTKESVTGRNKLWNLLKSFA
ncbi:MAG: SDR family NAD(P)-dependent oxidoreductase [Chlamydiota bacterium]|nr:SDR family NAD(P)-dependent oxidoreductase [Chlamydiota bacterium]